MGAFKDYLDSIISTLAGIVPFGGTLDTPSEEDPIAIAQKIKGNTFVVESLEVLADIPYKMLQKDMEVIVSQHTLGSGTVMPKTRYSLKEMPPANTKVNEVPSYVLSNYWIPVVYGSERFEEDPEIQYAPNYDGKRPRFLPSEIESDAYQAGYPTTESFDLGNPSDIIWVDDFDPTKNHVWIRQRTGPTRPWGIPISISGATDYETNQYLDVIFKWIPKGDPRPDRPIQPDDYALLPTGWSNTPGDNYSTRILTEDLYRSQALKNPYGVIKSNGWDIPILVSSDPDLVRYGNTPGNTDFLNDTYWRGYYTPGLDTHMASRPTAVSTDWVITKIDDESGEFEDIVFKVFPLGVTLAELQAAIPTSPIPIGGASPNNCNDAPPAYDRNTETLYMSKSTRYADGSFKVPWSIWRRFDGMDAINAFLEATPGDVFYETRVNGELTDSIEYIDIVAKLYRGIEEIDLSAAEEIVWLRGATEIVFDPTTRYAINLGVGLNAYHQVSVDGQSLRVYPLGVDVTQEYKINITQYENQTAPFEANILLRDATDDGEAFINDILPIHGTTFRNNSGLYRFDSQFIKGGAIDNTGVTFKWTLLDASLNPVADGIRDSGGVSLGTSDVVANTVYVRGQDVDTLSILKCVAEFGDITREDRITLTDVADVTGVDVLYWGTGDVDPGNPTDFTPRTLTTQEVLDLDYGYLEPDDAEGAWYMIVRVNGEWGSEIRIRGEGARPNGALQLFIFKNVDESVDGIPTAPNVPASGSLIPSGWTQTPTARTGLQDATYMSQHMFLLRTDVAADPTLLDRDNFNPTGAAYGEPIRTNGDTPPPVEPGDDGWSPVFANETFTHPTTGKIHVVQKVVGWIGGTGTEPASNTSTSYVGPAGFTTRDNATNIKGEDGAPGTTKPEIFITTTATHKGDYSSGAVSSRSIDVTNNHSQPRRFQINAEAYFVGDNGLSSSGFTDTDTSASLVLDNASGTDPVLDIGYLFVPSPGNEGKLLKISLSTTYVIPAGETLKFTVKHSSGLSSSEGVNRKGLYIEAYGL
jgi:hypothetical protein